MVAKIAATVGVDSTNLVNSSASDWGSAKSCVAVSVATIIIYRANFPNVRTCICNGTKELREWLIFVNLI